MAGFECEFVEKPPKAFQCECPVCLLVLREPYQATCCGNSFCRQCADQAKARNQVCPTCNSRNFNLFHNLGLQRSLYDFRVYCKHNSQGCEWIGELREFDNHLNSDPPTDKALQGCPYETIACPLRCAGCKTGVSRKNYNIHIGDNIDKLLSLVMGQAAQIDSVEQRSTQLTERLANIEGDKQYLEQHILELEAKHNEKIKKLESKCKELEKESQEMKGQLSSIEGDNQYLQQQLTESETKVGKLDEKVRELKLKKRELENEMEMSQLAISSSRQPDQPSSNQVTGTYKPREAEFTMTDFEEYKRDYEEWYSPHFYTHTNGYKMCLNVGANGIGSGKGTHLSVFVCLMRGEFDDQLKWPFRGKITVKLVNQEEDKDHVVETIPFTSSIDQECCERVMVEGQRGTGQGYGQVLPHTQLQPKYLKNNCIKLSIKTVELF